MADGYEYYYDVVRTARFDRMQGHLNALGHRGWRLAHVVSHTEGFAAHGDLLLVWERPLPAKRTP